MTKPIVVRMEEFHLEELRPGLPKKSIKLLAAYPSFAMECGEETIAIGGAIPAWPGRVRLWLISGSGAGRYAIHIAKTCRRFVDIAVKENHRVECVCFDPSSARLAKMLSFKQESIMRHHQPNIDAFLFSITR